MRRAAAFAFVLALAPASFGQRGGATIEHVVAPGETLWSIAWLPDVYADPYLWPLIYKFNRDQITDPSMIYPNQILQIPVDVGEQAKREARAEAGGS